ncbi:MAG TPA: ABC transporter ATP-binding protein [Candidatus Dormibacteraeota bacterium]
MSEAPLLSIRGLNAGYGAGPVLFDIELEVRGGELAALIGANGAGKSTLLGVVSGLVRASSGRVEFAGRDITGMAAERIVALGLVHVPQGRRLFSTLSVEKNLLLGAYRRGRGGAGPRAQVERVLEYFPALKNKLRQEAGTLSGGEQQMVAIGRGLMADPRLIMIDEPSLGLAPNIVERVVDVAREIHKAGTSVLLVEQDVVVALETAERAYVLENGRIALAGAAGDLINDERVRKAYLGV